MTKNKKFFFKKVLFLKKMKKIFLFLSILFLLFLNSLGQITYYVDCQGGSGNTFATVSEALAQCNSTNDYIIVLQCVVDDSIYISNPIFNSLTVKGDTSFNTGIVSNKSYCLKINQTQEKSINFEGIDFLCTGNSSAVVRALNLNQALYFKDCSFEGPDTLFSIGGDTYCYVSFEKCNFQGGKYSIFLKPTLDNYLIVKSSEFTNFSVTAIKSSNHSLRLIKNYFTSLSTNATALDLSENISLDSILGNRFIFDNNATNLIKITNCNAFTLFVNNMISFASTNFDANFIRLENCQNIIFQHNNFGTFQNKSPHAVISADNSSFQASYNIFENHNLIYDLSNTLINNFNVHHNAFHTTNLYNVANLNGTIYNLTDWVSIKDFGSLPIYYPYFSFTNLHVSSPEVIGKANGSYLYEDFDGQRRKIVPDIGADEVGGRLQNYYINSQIEINGYFLIDTTITVGPSGRIILQSGSYLGFTPGGKIVFNGGSLQSYSSNLPILVIGGGEDYIFEFNNSYNNNLYNLRFLNCSKILKAQNSQMNLWGIEVSDYTTQPIDTAFNFYKTEYYLKNSKFINCNVYNFIVSASDDIPLQPRKITNCLFANNFGNKFLVANNENIIIQNNTIYENQHYGNYDASISLYNCTGEIRNNIIYAYNFGNPDTSVVISTNLPFQFKYNLVRGYSLLGQNIVSQNIINDFPHLEDPVAGNFKLKSFSPCIDAGDATNLVEYYDAEGNPRPFGVAPDLGAFEYQGLKFYFSAGQDTILCDNKYKLNGVVTGNVSMQWQFIVGGGMIMNENDPQSWVYDLAKGVNALLMIVFDGQNYFYDTVFITNNLPNADAGPDISLYSEYPDLITTVQLQAQSLTTGEFGSWSVVSGGGNIIDINSPVTVISNLSYGVNILRWNVIGFGCEASDSVIIYVGYIRQPQNDGDWLDPNTWGGLIPGVEDSVVIAGKNLIISTAGGCSSLLVSSGGSLTIEGSGKIPATFNVRKIYVEQNTKKFPQYRNEASLVVRNGIININSETGEEKDYGLIVGSGGTLLLEPNTATAQPTINIGAGLKFLVAESAHFKDEKGGANVILKNGSRIVVEQTAEKSGYGGVANVIVRGGGKIVVEQTAEKFTDVSELRVRGSIVLEQSAQSVLEALIVVAGGKIIVEQTGAKGVSNDNIIVSRGSRIVVEQTAEKSKLLTSLIEVPNLLIKGGQVLVGNSATNSTGSKVTFSRIVVEQTAEKNSLVENLVVYPFASLDANSISDSIAIFQYSNSRVTFYPNAIINLGTRKYLLHEGATLVNHSFADIDAIVQVTLVTDHSRLVSFPFVPFQIGSLSTWININAYQNNFYPLSANSILETGYGYLFVPKANAYAQFMGLLFKGDKNVDLYSGFNLVGNPYTSYLILDSLAAIDNIQRAIYVYDNSINNYQVINSTGIDLFATDRNLKPTEGWFVYAPTNGNLLFKTSYQTHNISQSKENRGENFIVFKVEKDGIVDKWALDINSEATDGYDAAYDAVELVPWSGSFVSLTSVLPDNKKLCIDSRNVSNQSNINLSFSSNMEGVVNFSLDSVNLPSEINFYVKDLLTNSIYYLNQQSSFNFYYSLGTERNFQLVVGNALAVDEKVQNLQVYTYKQKLYIQSNEIVDQVIVYNLSGIKVYDFKVGSYSASIPLKLSAGVYLVSVRVGNATYVRKIVY